MRRPKRANFGEIRYPAQKSEAAVDQHNDVHNSRWAWLFADMDLSRAFNNLIDLKTGFAEKQKSYRESGAYAKPEPPLQTEKEAHAHLRKVWIHDLALQQATKGLPYPYRREKSIAEEIKESNTEQIAVEKEIEAGITEKDLPLLSYDDPDWGKNEARYLRFIGSPFAGDLRKNIDQLSQEIEIAAEIEAALLKEIPKNHPQVTTEIKRIKELIKADPNLENWGEFLDKVFGPN